MRSDFYAGTVRELVRDIATKREGSPRDGILVDLSDLAHQSFEALDQRKKWRDMPAMRPPWELAWLEYTIPRTIPHPDGGNGRYRVPIGGSRVGFFVVTEPVWRPDGLDPGFAVMREKMSAESYRTLLQGIDLEGSIVYAHAYLWLTGQRQPEPSHMTLYYLLDRRGQYYGKTMFDLEQPGYEHLDLGSIAEDATLYGTTPAFGWFMGVYGPVAQAFALLNCKNIRTVDNLPPPKVKAKRERSGEPVLTYKTLVVDSRLAKLRREGDPEPTGVRMAQHVRRGHFKTYTAERPLFGRVTGTFWVDQHLAGSPDVGRVEKDYRVRG